MSIDLQKRIEKASKGQPCTGEFVCPRCGNRMVRYRVDVRSVNAACGKAGCLRLSYRLKKVRVSKSQMQLLLAMRSGAKVRAERAWWLAGAQSSRITFRCDGHDKWGGWPKRPTLEILHKRYGLLIKTPGPERDGQVTYRLNHKQCRQLDIWNSQPKG